MIFNDNEKIYFNQEVSNCTGNFEKLCFNINNNKINIYDCDNDNIKISIKKIINPNSKNGAFMLFYLGYDNKDYKMIIKCKYKIKNAYCYNNYNYNYLFIISSVSHNGPKILYKYRIHKDKMIYNNTLIQNIF